MSKRGQVILARGRVRELELYLLSCCDEKGELLLADKPISTWHKCHSRGNPASSGVPPLRDWLALAEFNLPFDELCLSLAKAGNDAALLPP